jgi:O-antigen/teichoic acid export membrane protein
VAHETTKALRNALVLTGSLVATLAVAIAVRFWMPRFLGPDLFGQVYFAESFTAATVVFLNFGIDTYINREIATRLEHASDFIGGIIILRALATIVVFIAMAVILFLMGKSALEWQLVYIFGAGQLFFTFNGTLQAILNARGEVRELALVNVASKIIWGGLVVGSLALHGALLLVAGAFLVTEAAKMLALIGICRKYVKLELRWEPKAAIAVIITSLPFYLNYLAHDIYARVDSIMLSWMISDAETAWYGAAVNINLLALLVLPIMNAVLMPMSSRVIKQSPEALETVMRGTLRIVLVLSVPLTLMLVLHAHAAVRLFFGGEYAPSARTLQILAPVIPLSYVCVVSAAHLVQLDKIWSVTRIAVIGLIVHPLLNSVTIPQGGSWFGEGGSGMGAAAASLTSEMMVATLFFTALGKAGPDRAFGINMAKLAAVCAAVAGLHQVLPLFAPDPTHPMTLWRVPLELVLYVGLGTALGAIPLREMLQHLSSALSRRRGGSHPRAAE